MKLALVSMHTSPVETPGRGDAGGMNVVVRHLADALADLGHDVDLITRRACSDCPPVERLRDGVRLVRLDAGPARALPKSHIDAFIGEFSAALGELAPYELVHSHHWMSGVAALPAARAWGVPHVQSFHSVAAHPNSPLRDGEPPESPARVPGEVLVARQSDLVVAVSHAEAATVIGRCGADPQRVVIVTPGVDVDTFRPADAKTWAPAGVVGDYVLFAARLQPLKGADLALAAVAGVDESVRPTLVIAGEASADFADYAAELQALERDLGMSRHVVHLPSQSRDDFARLVRHARVMLVPSHSETFGLVALEASASGVPVIASAAGGLTEAVQDDATGLLVCSRRPDDWSDALARVLTDSGLAARLGSAGRQFALAHTWPQAAAALSAHYHRLTSATGR